MTETPVSHLHPPLAGVALMVTALLVGLALDPTASDARAASVQTCKNVVYRVNGYEHARTYGLRASRVSCTRARQVASRWLRTAEGSATPPRPYGYHCRPSSTITCRKGSRRITWRSSSSRTALIVPAGAAAQATARAARACAGITFTPNSDDGISRLRATGVSCRTARRVARKARRQRAPFRYRYDGFSCRGAGRPSYTAWRCTRRSARVTFNRS